MASRLEENEFTLMVSGMRGSGKILENRSTWTKATRAKVIFEEW
jgi:hypothetical protein